MTTNSKSEAPGVQAINLAALGLDCISCGKLPTFIGAFVGCPDSPTAKRLIICALCYRRVPTDKAFANTVAARVQMVLKRVFIEDLAESFSVPLHELSAALNGLQADENSALERLKGFSISEVLAILGRVTTGQNS